MRLMIVVPAFFLASLMLVACGGPTAGQANKSAGSAPGDGGQLAVKSLDTMRYDPPNATVRVNTPVRLTLDNSGQSIAHDWTVDSLDGQKVQVKAEPRQQASGTFTASTAGTYQFYCSEPGHRDAGMVGTLTAN